MLILTPIIFPKIFEKLNTKINMTVHHTVKISARQWFAKFQRIQTGNFHFLVMGRTGMCILTAGNGHMT